MTLVRGNDERNGRDFTEACYFVDSYYWRRIIKIQRLEKSKAETTLWKIEWQQRGHSMGKWLLIEWERDFHIRTIFTPRKHNDAARETVPFCQLTKHRHGWTNTIHCCESSLDFSSTDPDIYSISV